jgi:hypothetical protein
LSIWRLPCNSVFIIDKPVALDPNKLWIYRINWKEDCEFVRRRWA